MVYDTNVLAYAVLNIEPFQGSAVWALEAANEVLVPDSFRAELTNVVWTVIRAGRTTLQRGLGALAYADALVDETVPATDLWCDALSLAVEANHPAYDTLFVALARQRGTRLVTYDRKLRRCFPADTVAPDELGPRCQDRRDADSPEPTL